MKTTFKTVALLALCIGTLSSAHAGWFGFGSKENNLVKEDGTPRTPEEMFAYEKSKASKGGPSETNRKIAPFNYIQIYVLAFDKNQSQTDSTSAYQGDLNSTIASTNLQTAAIDIAAGAISGTSIMSSGMQVGGLLLGFLGGVNDRVAQDLIESYYKVVSQNGLTLISEVAPPLIKKRSIALFWLGPSYCRT